MANLISVMRAYEANQRIVQMQDVQERFAVLGFEAGSGTPEQFRNIMRAEIDKWAKVVKEAGIRPE